jgi:ABC-2 type transport system permease protein
MKTILKIAFHELKLLFCSPIAWMLLVILLWQFGDTFAGNLSGIGPDFLKFYPGYTDWLFSGNVFPMVDSKIYFYIPLMTMGLMSQELSSGNIKLLFSSPVKTANIVLGKYLGIMFYWLIVICLFTLYAVPTDFIIDNVDLGIVLPGIFSLFLLACTYSALGLFMSCLSSYQIVAALCTLTALAALNYIGGMWQGIPVLKDIINFLYMAGHAENLNAGFIKSKDVLYFVVISGLFLGLAIFYIQDMVQARTRIKRARRYVLFTGLMLFLGVLVSLRSFTIYFDTTATKFHTISKSSQELLKKIKGPVTVTAYSNLLDHKNETNVGIPENRANDFDFWEPYIRFLPQLELKYVNYYVSADTMKSPAALDSAANRVAEAQGWYIEDYLNPRQINSIIDLKPEHYTFVRNVEQGKKHHFLRVFHDFFHVPFEKEIMTAFSGLVTDYPRIVFLSGNYERSDDNDDRDYRLMMNERTARASLINQGFDVSTVSVNDSIPAGIAALVVAEPLTAFTPLALGKIQRFIAAGGNLLVTGGPGSQKILNPLVEPLGVQFMDGQIVQRNPDFLPDMVFTRTPLREGGDPYPFQFASPLAMPATIALKYRKDAGFKVEEAVVTDENTTWNKIGPIPSDTAKIVFEPKNGDNHQQLPVALSLTRNAGKKEQRIMIVGNGNFISNENMTRDFHNLALSQTAFGTAIFKWFGDGTYPVTISPGAHLADVTYNLQGFAKFRPFYTWLPPVLALLAGAVFLFRRRRK